MCVEYCHSSSPCGCFVMETTLCEHECFFEAVYPELYDLLVRADERAPRPKLKNAVVVGSVCCPECATTRTYAVDREVALRFREGGCIVAELRRRSKAALLWEEACRAAHRTWKSM